MKVFGSKSFDSLGLKVEKMNVGEWITEEISGMEHMGHANWL